MTPRGCIPDTRTLGVDEAGRGPILGPMVLAGVVLRPRAAAALTRAGVTDSKAFGAGDDAHARRTELAARIHASAESVIVRVVEVEEIDRRVVRGELNALERDHAAAIIDASAAHDKIVADGATLFGPLAARYPTLRATDRGESAHVSVAAASVVAKARRDELFGVIARRYEPDFGPIRGGGYSNAETLRFLRAYLERHARLPPEARRSYSWAQLTAHFPPGYDPLSELPPGTVPQLSLL